MCDLNLGCAKILNSDVNEKICIQIAHQLLRTQNGVLYAILDEVNNVVTVHIMAIAMLRFHHSRFPAVCET